MEASEDEKFKKEWVIGKLQTEIIALIEDNESAQKAEYNAFTHSVNVQRMAEALHLQAYCFSKTNIAQNALL